MQQSIMSEIEESGILMRSEMTLEEYHEELLEFQELFCSIIPEEWCAQRLNDAISYYERTARKKGVDRDPVFRSGIKALGQINKEIAISMAGRNGEEHVAKMLGYISRPSYVFKNIYVSEGTLEAELDNVILTASGLIILEVKRTKEDITISQSGRILYSNKECHHDVSVCEKMQRRRDLLKSELENYFRERELDIPVRVDSYIVFSVPKGVFITVNDLCHKEKYCFAGKLPFVINEYCSDGLYSDAEMGELNTALQAMKNCQKRFAVNLNFADLFQRIEKALAVCMDHPGEPAAEQVTLEDKTVQDDPMQKEKERRRLWRKFPLKEGGIAAACLTVFTVILLMSGQIVRKA